MLETISKDVPFPRPADFYNGKSVFITGAAGFLGSVLLESLLRNCPGVKSIYILLRSKKNQQPEDRKEQIFKKKIFEKIKEENPKLLEKVHVIAGDISLPKLGMKEENVQLLVEEVSVVFHCAAILSFVTPLQFTLINNVLGLSFIIELCREMKKFEVLVYTSTAYCASNLPDLAVREEVFRLPFRAEKFLEALRNEDYETLQQLVAYCKPDWPNAYAFSKCLAENLIQDMASDLPVAIIRPSVIIYTLKNPMPGYVEESSGLMAFCVGIGKGFIKVIHADPEVHFDFVPADIVANAHVLAAWSVGTKRCPSLWVVNCTASENFRIKLWKTVAAFQQLSDEFPFPLAFEKSRRLIITSKKYLYYTYAAFHHYLPAIVLDGILRILRKTPRLYFKYRFYDKVLDSTSFFLFHDFEFERENIELLDELVPLEDKMDLGLDFKQATVCGTMNSMPEASPFYDWKIDRKSKLERQRTQNNRHILITSVQWIFLIICSLFIYWVFSLFYH